MKFYEVWCGLLMFADGFGAWNSSHRDLWWSLMIFACHCHPPRTQIRPWLPVQPELASGGRSPAQALQSWSWNGSLQKKIEFSWSFPVEVWEFQIPFMNYLFHSFDLHRCFLRLMDTKWMDGQDVHFLLARPHTLDGFPTTQLIISVGCSLLWQSQ